MRITDLLKCYSYKVIIPSLAFLNFATLSYGGDFDIRGQLSVTGLGFYSNNSFNKFLGLRYIPQVTFTEYLNDDIFVDSEIDLNTYFNYDFHTTEHNIKLYRLKLRLATPQTEFQIGLQKINFGPAFILRSLRWFDRLDPRDPLGLTEGVYAIRLKQSFLDNSSVMLWGLYRNKETKGYDLLPTSEKKPELGGRLQFPLFDGELAFTGNTRIVNASSFEYRETKAAIDGRWDVEVGLWFESVLQKNDSQLLPFRWNSMTTLGTDYTFDIGNGLHVIGEHMFTSVSDKVFGTDTKFNVSAIMMNYPLTLFDNIMLLGFYSWDNKELYKFIQWQRVYDDFIIGVNLFHYPESNLSSFSSNTNIPSRGYGFQLTLIYNH